jgi:hypothetical protein
LVYLGSENRQSLAPRRTRGYARRRLGCSNIAASYTLSRNAESLAASCRSSTPGALAAGIAARLPSCATVVSSALCRLSTPFCVVPVANTSRSNSRKSFMSADSWRLERSIAWRLRGLTARFSTATSWRALVSTRSRRSSHSIQNRGLYIRDFPVCCEQLKCCRGTYYFKRRLPGLHRARYYWISRGAVHPPNWLVAYTG